MTSAHSPRISVIIPVFNAERYLATCLDSLIAQTYSDFEAIIVNDGSTDRSRELIAEYCSRDKRLRTIEKSNEGQGLARNLGFREAIGKYIYFYDADDCLHPDAFRLMIGMAELNRIDALYIDYEVIYGDERPTATIAAFHNEYTYGKRRAIMTLEAMPWLFFFRKSALDISGVNFPSYFHEDEAEIYRIIIHCERIVRVTGPIYFYRKHSSSTTGLKINIRTRDIIKVVTRFMELAQIYPQYSLEFKKKAYSMLSSYIDAWTAIEEQWAREALTEALLIKEHLDEDIRDNPYWFVREDTLSEIHHSHFWKVTGPIRFAIEIFKHTRTMLMHGR